MKHHLEENDNKVAEIVLKGVNVLMTKCEGFDDMIRTNQDLRSLIEEETNVLFQLTHHTAFKI